MAFGRYAADGGWNVTVVDGLTFTGLFAADGSINVKSRVGEYGNYHPCGAILVTLVTTPQTSKYASDGSLNVAQTVQHGSQLITIVAGSFGPPPTGFYYPYIFI